MNPIQINRITIARVFCRILCILYVMAAAWNDGVSTVVLGIPFGFYLLYDAYQIKDSNKVLSVVLGMSTALIALSSQYDRSGWQWFYPALQQPITVSHDTPIMLNPYHPFTLSLSPSASSVPTPSLYVIKAGSSITLHHQHITQRNTQDTTYLYGITLADNQQHRLLVNEAQKRPIKWLTLDEDFYKYLSRETLYVTRHTLDTLSAPHQINTSPSMTWLLWLLQTPVVLCALLCLNIVRKIAWRGSPSVFEQISSQLGTRKP